MPEKVCNNNQIFRSILHGYLQVLKRKFLHLSFGAIFREILSCEAYSLTVHSDVLFRSRKWFTMVRK